MVSRWSVAQRDVATACLMRAALDALEARWQAAYLQAWGTAVQAELRSQGIIVTVEVRPDLTADPDTAARGQDWLPDLDDLATILGTPTTRFGPPRSTSPAPWSVSPGKDRRAATCLRGPCPDTGEAPRSAGGLSSCYLRPNNLTNSRKDFCRAGVQ